ncbi:Phage terminase-like protein, large subunit, contains N-terminal HTH domain [Leifsonia sp. 98AMF]|nr:Phage terminase-like protein, large subunit, contains N-terminal HTH domain [Leifsonia sp. 197AMF]SDJ22242.1 Phage terminase-like protein, large subunit, contains N-terminal HTH domain [Leifsonia sp. 466MF]SDK61459.1 Phage terminase-like protein, large subunit, contains N-terminal HTH domain [Leifsonia sp. 157MF]SDN43929.1 Phage terminase-like protein, large subunit, contains N-terminal HTH domain [Leifsonia sp. 509MF]SEN67144.1 Phage terminase-like protein, large subunit, contains N-termina
MTLTPPRKVTPRDYSRRTHGPKVAAIAAEMGQPLLPWQRYVADVALEVDSFGLFVYSTVLVTVPRQAGKTTLDLAASIQNALMGRNRRTWYTAQSGQHATEKFLEMVELWESSALRGLAPKARRSNGSAALPFVNGSKFRPFAPVEGALDGKQADKVSLDEFWYWTAAQYAILRQSFSATKLTREMVTGQRPQTWIFSTEGTVESTALNGMLDEFRSGTPDPTVAGFDWGIGDDDDPFDLDRIYARHPGAGHLFTREGLEAFRAEFADSPGEFARAFGNRRTGATERVIPVGAWRDAAWNDPTPPAPGRVCFAAAVGVDGVDTTITATQVHGAGTLSAVVKGGWMESTYGALAKLRELRAKYPDAGFIIDPNGPSAALHDEVQRAGFELIPVGTREVIAATQATVAGITNPAGPTWRYRPHDKLEAAAELATKRFAGDGTWLFGRRASVGSISALESANLGAYGVLHLPAVRSLQLG